MSSVIRVAVRMLSIWPNPERAAWAVNQVSMKPANLYSTSVGQEILAFLHEHPQLSRPSRQQLQAQASDKAAESSCSALPGGLCDQISGLSDSTLYPYLLGCFNIVV